MKIYKVKQTKDFSDETEFFLKSDVDKLINEIKRVNGTNFLSDSFYDLTKCNTFDELIKALRKVNELHNLGDAIYDVRDRAEYPDGYDGSSWDLPEVKEYGQAVDVINKFLKEYNP